MRDPRFALHSGTDEPEDWPGEAKVAGTVRAETRTSKHDGEQYHRFRADITEAVLVFLNDERTKLVVESWHEGGVCRVSSGNVDGAWHREGHRPVA